MIFGSSLGCWNGTNEKVVDVGKGQFSVWHRQITKGVLSLEEEQFERF